MMDQTDEQIEVASVDMSDDSENDDAEFEEIVPPRDDSVTTIKQHSKAVFCVAVDSECRFIVSGSMDDAAVVCAVPSFERVFECEGHNDTVIQIEFSLTNELLATGDLEGVVQLFRLAEKPGKPASSTSSPVRRSRRLSSNSSDQSNDAATATSQSQTSSIASLPANQIEFLPHYRLELGVELVQLHFFWLCNSQEEAQSGVPLELLQTTDTEGNVSVWRAPFLLDSDLQRNYFPGHGFGCSASRILFDGAVVMVMGNYRKRRAPPMNNEEEPDANEMEEDEQDEVEEEERATEETTLQMFSLDRSLVDKIAVNPIRIGEDHDITSELTVSSRIRAPPSSSSASAASTSSSSNQKRARRGGSSGAASCDEEWVAMGTADGKVALIHLWLKGKEKRELCSSSVAFIPVTTTARDDATDTADDEDDAIEQLAFFTRRRDTLLAVATRQGRIAVLNVKTRNVLEIWNYVNAPSSSHSLALAANQQQQQEREGEDQAGAARQPITVNQMIGGASAADWRPQIHQEQQKVEDGCFFTAGLDARICKWSVCEAAPPLPAAAAPMKTTHTYTARQPIKEWHGHRLPIWKLVCVEAPATHRQRVRPESDVTTRDKEAGHNQEDRRCRYLVTASEDTTVKVFEE